MERPDLELDPQLELRRLIDEAKRAARPDARTEARVLSTLLTRLPPGSPTDGGPPPGADAPIVGVASLTTLKIVIGGAIAAGAIAIGAVTVRDPPPSPTRPASHEPRAPESVPAPVSAASLPTPITVPTPAAMPAPTNESRAPARNAAPRMPAATSADAITAELELVSAAEAALARGNDREALDLANTHRERHPRGQLALERDAIAAAASCGLGDPDAPRRAAAFLAAHPRAAAAPKVRARCEAPTKKADPQ